MIFSRGDLTFCKFFHKLTSCLISSGTFVPEFFIGRMGGLSVLYNHEE